MRAPHTLEMYIQDANTPATVKKSRRRRRKKLAAPPFVAALDPSREIPVPIKPKRSKRKSKLKTCALQRRQSPQSCNFRVRGLISVEELQDEDEVEDIQDEIRTDFGRFGQLKTVAIVREDAVDELVGDVNITFEDSANALLAFAAYDGKVFGGKTVTCVWESQRNSKKNSVVVRGMLTPEELEDPDEAADVEEEMMQIFSNYGEVEGLQLSESTGEVTVDFKEERDAEKAVTAMNGSQYGGRDVSARLEQTNDVLADDINAVSSPRLVTKRFVTPIIQPTESVDLQNLVGALLKRLAALQERAHIQGKLNKLSRRFVLGMHEVRRGLLCNKIVLLVTATDLDGCEVVEEKYAELIAIAAEREVPILAPMNRRKLGKVMQMSVRVSCVGVYSVDGANSLFLEILQKMKATAPR